MSSSSYYFFHFCFLLIISTCLAKTNNFHPKTLFLAVKKDPSSLQYITQVNQRTPLVPIKLAVHLGGEILWVDCQEGYKSSTYKYAHCKSPVCTRARSVACNDACQEKTRRPGCNDNPCLSFVDNPALRATVFDEIAEDVLTIQSVNDSIPGPVATVPKFIFSCSQTFMTQKLGENVKGMVGFGQNRPASLAAQFASAFRFSRKFGICLSSSTDRNGVIFIGNSPYYLSLAFDASQNLIYTPIITYPRYQNYNQSSPHYYIQVSSIKISGKNVPIKKTLLTLDAEDEGGTRLSTANPYTILEPSVYKAVSKAFVSEMPKDVKTVSPVFPFKTCFNSTFIGMSRLGYNAPQIELVLHKPNVYWTITGANSLVKVSDNVICLAFVEREETYGQAIVIGGYQMQDNLVEFDLSRNRIGFSNSLFFRQTMCSNHNYA